MNDRDFSDSLCWIANSPVLALDTETNGLHPHEFDRITGISAANETHAVYFPLRHPGSNNLSYDQARNLIELLSQPRERIIFHNALFDWAFLRTDGWSYPDAWKDTWDTMVACWVADENEPKKLEEQVAIHLGLEGVRRANAQKQRQKRIKKIGWANVTADDIQAYGAADARNTFDLYRVQRARFAADVDLTTALEREHRFLNVVDEMICNGIKIDDEQARKKLHECDVGIAMLEDEYPGLNFDSPKQLGELLFSDEGWGIVPSAFTSTGQPATDKDTLMAFLPYEPRIDDIFRYRKLRKARSTYYVPLCERVGRDGRIHSWYRPHGTKTGRMACSEPNLQTLPNPATLPGIKECFIAKDGHSLMEYDLEQAELRVAADYADDYVLQAHLASGDVHAATAIAMFGDAEGRHRHIGKTINFSSLYGIGALKLSRTALRGGVTLSEDQARQYLGQWRNLYHGVAQAFDDAKLIAETRGYVNLWPTGRRRRFNTHAARFENPKDAFSSLVQGGVGEYVKNLMLALQEPARLAGTKLVMNCHDSLCFDVPIGMEERWSSVVKTIAAHINPFQISMPLGAKRW